MMDARDDTGTHTHTHIHIHIALQVKPYIKASGYGYRCKDRASFPQTMPLFPILSLREEADD